MGKCLYRIRSRQRQKKLDETIESSQSDSQGASRAVNGVLNGVVWGDREVVKADYKRAGEGWSGLEQDCMSLGVSGRP